MAAPTSRREPARDGARAPRTSIAIVGMGCRFPGAPDLTAFWRLLREGIDAVGEVPPGRFDVGPWFDPRPGTPGKLYTKWGGFLDDVDRFDAGFFRIAPREAIRMDPQQRLALEVAAEALEDAGLVAERLRGASASVFMGLCTTDFGDLVFHEGDPRGIDIYASAGNARSVLAGRMSYAFGLEGPSVAVDTACSSSLVAVHLACRSLLAGESDLALAGGVNLLLSPMPSLGFAQARMLARDGRCKAFDARGDGFVRSDGAGVVVLKRLADALADGDPIHAVIRGSAVNNDGQSGGLLMTPSARGQEEVLRRAYAAAACDPADVGFVECHGTGTTVGDPIEVEALGAVLGRHDAAHPCYLGSVKTNIGHAEGAAGVAGLVKAVLAVRHGVIPPNLHFEIPNPAIPFDGLGFAVPREATPWRAPGPRRAGVSSFGISGTNAHIVLEEAPRDVAPAATLATTTAGNGHAPATVTAPDASPPAARLLVLSAHSAPALDALAGRWIAWLDGEGADAPLDDVVWTAAARRNHHEHRLAATFGSREELRAALVAHRAGEAAPGIATGRRPAGGAPRVAFVFPGQGSQWSGMGIALAREEPAFRAALERCETAFARHVSWSLRDVLAAPADRSRLGEVDVVQPALFAMQVALAALWRAWGIEPAAVIGQSLGEVAAAYVAGVLDLDDATRIICERSRLVRAMGGGGRMAVVGLPRLDAEAAIAPHDGRVSVAIESSAASTVLAGEEPALAAVERDLLARGLLFRWVNVDYASHSAFVDPVRAPLAEALRGVRPRRPEIPLYSTVHGRILGEGEADAAYWWRNLREPVAFASTLDRMFDDGFTCFVESSPHPVAASAVQQQILHRGVDGVALATLRRDEPERAVALGALGALHVRGVEVEWPRLVPQGRCVSLPALPWQRERYWPDDLHGAAARARRGGGDHPFLGAMWRSAAHDRTWFFETDLGLDAAPWLTDHRVRGIAVFPAAAWVEAAFAAVRAALGPAAGADVWRLETLDLENPLTLPDDGTRRVQLVLRAPAEGEARLTWFGAVGEHGGWTRLATATLAHEATDAAGQGPAVDSSGDRAGVDLGAAIARCATALTAGEHYTGAARRDLDYGPAFRTVTEIRRRDGEALARVALPESLAAEPGVLAVHPALLDGCVQAFLPALPREDPRAGAGDVYLPVRLGRLRILGDPARGAWCRATIHIPDADPWDRLDGSLAFVDETGRPVLVLDEVVVRRIRRGAGGEKSLDRDGWLYETRWEAVPVAEPAAPPPDARHLIAGDGPEADALAERIRTRGGACDRARAPEAPYRDVIFVAPPFGAGADRMFDGESKRGHATEHGDVLPEPDADALDAAQHTAYAAALVLAQELAARPAPPRLWIVTRGVHVPDGSTGGPGDGTALAHAPLWGFGRTLAQEAPALRAALVDLPAAAGDADVDALLDAIERNGDEPQLAIRTGRFFAPRLVHRPWGAPPDARDRGGRAFHAAVDRNVRLEIETPGVLDGLVLRPAACPAPGPGEIAIEVEAAGLNFRDVLVAMGLLVHADGSRSLGYECAGRVEAAGEGVVAFRPGDRVVALCRDGFGRRVIVRADFAQVLPEGLSMAEGATLPIAYTTAHYALAHLARMEPGERVLVHTASGGVGLAALAVARALGAEVLATAGSETKRAFLRARGVAHVFDSRSLSFAGDVLRATGGEGVDVVLNTLTGDAVEAGLRVLRPGGRFIELGKTDILENRAVGLGLFERNIAYHAVDLDRLERDRPDVAAARFAGAMRFVVAEHLPPVPHAAFPLAAAAEAFRRLARAQHTGKLVIETDPAGARVVPLAGERFEAAADGTYLVTGGLGGLGLATARRLVERGARHLVLLGRREPTAEAAAAIETMEAAGTRVMTIAVDVADGTALAAALERIRAAMPPLRGVFHAAGLLDDGVLAGQTPERYRAVAAPKARGAWNLHRLTAGDPLDAFVLFSSAAGLFGSAGQANYAAANTFLDALALYRRRRGLPGLGVQWGPWSEVGLAARPDRGGRLERRGLGSFSPEEGSDVLEHLLLASPAAVGAFAMDWAAWGSHFGRGATPPFFAHVLDGSGGAALSTSAPTRRELAALDPAARAARLEAHLLEQLARVLGHAAGAHVDPLRPLNTLGVDSLMAVELRNRIEAEFGVAVAVGSLLKGTSLRDLAGTLAAELGGAAVADGEAVDEILGEIERLTDDEARALLDPGDRG